MSLTSKLQTTKGGKIFKILEILFTALVSLKPKSSNISVRCGLFRIIFFMCMCVCIFFEAVACSISSGLICLHSIFYERIWWIFYLSIFHISVGSSWVCVGLCIPYTNECINAIPSLLHLNIHFFFFYLSTCMAHTNISKVSDMWLNNSFVVRRSPLPLTLIFSLSKCFAIMSSGLERCKCKRSENWMCEFHQHTN